MVLRVAVRDKRGLQAIHFHGPSLGYLQHLCMCVR